MFKQPHREALDEGSRFCPGSVASHTLRVVWVLFLVCHKEGLPSLVHLSQTPGQGEMWLLAFPALGLKVLYIYIF